jgi:hypothetical protein
MVGLGDGDHDRVDLPAGGGHRQVRFGKRLLSIRSALMVEQSLIASAIRFRADFSFVAGMTVKNSLAIILAR